MSRGPPRRVSHLYWVTAGLALAEQWNVTTLSSNTGCGSTDRLTSGGSAERRGALADYGAVCTTVWGNMRVKASNSTSSSHSPGGPQETGGLGRGLPPSLEVPDSGRPGSGVRTPAMDSSYCSVPKSCLTLCDPMDFSTPGFPILHYLPESAQTHVHRVGDAIQPSCTLSSPSPPALNLSQHQGWIQGWCLNEQPPRKQGGLGPRGCLLPTFQLWVNEPLPEREV